jgi:hypothetical protein
MTTISYRPELENPSRDAALAFSFLDGASKVIRTFTLSPGVNRQIDESTWAAVKDTPAVQALIKIKAIEVLATSEVSADVPTGAPPDLADVMGLPVTDAFKVIERSFDEAFLTTWKQAEGRSTLINKINQRLSRIKAGEG